MPYARPAFISSDPGWRLLASNSDAGAPRTLPAGVPLDLETDLGMTLRWRFLYVVYDARLTGPTGVPFDPVLVTPAESPTTLRGISCDGGDTEFWDSTLTNNPANAYPFEGISQPGSPQASTDDTWQPTDAQWDAAHGVWLYPHGSTVTFPDASTPDGTIQAWELFERTDIPTAPTGRIIMVV